MTHFTGTPEANAAKQDLDARTTLGLVSRLALGWVFVYSGFLKTVAAPEEFAAAIEAYGIIPAAWALRAAHWVPWGELYVGGFLMAGIFTRLSAVSLAGMLAVFEAALISAWIRKLPLADCGCFGAGAGHSISYAVIQDAILLAAAIIAFRHGGRMCAVDSWAEKEGP